MEDELFTVLSEVFFDVDSIVLPNKKQAGLPPRPSPLPPTSPSAPALDERTEEKVVEEKSSDEKISYSRISASSFREISVEHMQTVSSHLGNMNDHVSKIADSATKIISSLNESNQFLEKLVKNSQKDSASALVKMALSSGKSAAEMQTVFEEMYKIVSNS